MNTTTLNMTTLDGGVIIKKGDGGGGATINNQDKVVDITENGTTEVVADGGYTGLGKFTINTEVSGGGESASTIEYLDVSGLDYGSKNQLLFYSLIARTSQFEAFGQVQEPKVNLLGSVFMLIMADTANFSAYSNAVTAIGMDFTMQTKSSSGIMTVLDELKVMPVYEQLDSIPRLTKEQFYSLD